MTPDGNPEKETCSAAPDSQSVPGSAALREITADVASWLTALERPPVD